MFKFDVVVVVVVVAFFSNEINEALISFVLPVCRIEPTVEMEIASCQADKTPEMSTRSLSSTSRRLAERAHQRIQEDRR